MYITLIDAKKVNIPLTSEYHILPHQEQSLCQQIQI